MIAPAPPTGPAADVPTAAANRAEAYLAWRATQDGTLVLRWLLDRARERLAAGRRRISVNALVEAARVALGVPINNTYRAWLADELVMRDPGLLGVIERRRRAKPGPTLESETAHVGT